MKYSIDKDGLEEAMPSGNGTQKVDPSVCVTDLYLKGEPAGCVPLERTMQKPAAYTPAKSGPK